MASFKVQGGKALKGEIIPQGAKNEALQILCACLLSEDWVTIENLPAIRDVDVQIELLKAVGVAVIEDGKGNLKLCAKDVRMDMQQRDIIGERSRSLRGSVMMLGPLLARFGYAYIAPPGGDKIGRRRLDVHFSGFMALGAEFRYLESLGLYEVRSGRDGLQGTYMLLEEASVTGTANILMASVLAKGKTTIYNAACEPYIQQLCRMLTSMGAKISGIGSNLLEIEGVEKLNGCTHRLLPDMIEVGSFIGMAAMIGEGITIRGVGMEHLGIIPSSFKRLGIEIQAKDDDLYIPPHPSYTVDKFIDGSIMTIADSIWPGLTPDLLSIFLVVAVCADGSVLIHQKMFESRLFFVDKLIDMGARIILCDPHRAVVIGLGKHKLKGRVLVSPDIRAGVALLLAALSADGESIIHNIEQIDRGYERIDERLRALGADITRIDD